MVIKMKRNKVTPNLVSRYSDGFGHNLYLTAEEVKALGNPDAITITISVN